MMILTQEERTAELVRLIDRVRNLTRQLNLDFPAAMQLVTSITLEDLTRAQLTTAQRLEDLSRAILQAYAPGYKVFYVNATDIGDTEVIERVPDKIIRTVGYALNNGGASVATVHFRSGNRRISADKDLAADGGGMVAPVALGFWFDTAVGEALNINLLAAGTVGVDVTYVEVDPR